MEYQQCIDKAEEFRASYLERHTTPPDTLYHYTDAVGLLGIIRHSQLWLTNVRYTNDPGELVYAARMIAQCADAQKVRVGSVFDEFSQHIKRVLVGEPHKLPPTYAMCFCENGNLLSQWRGYGGNTLGYSIGFDASALIPPNPPATNVTPTPFLRKVTYDKHDQESMINEVFTRAADLIAQTEDPLAIKWDDGKNVYKAIAEFLISFKSGLFAEEQEWRLVQLYSAIGHLEFRVGAGLLKPYVVFTGAADKLPINSIIVGPGADGEEPIWAVKALLSEHGYDEGQICVKPSGGRYKA